ncbi:fumarylacetoacetase [Rhodococcus sp. BS-15]|uniref:fumarylacetoacetase n=1 Tax=Rhodococcus sp. BS-15 TaxID=1304954 RepID=UPI000AB84191|nr:fumarylacetoacetase [Rhodococcus sp. BS-15]
MTHIDIPADSEFGIDNLPYGIFSTPGTDARVGVRYGDNVIDLSVASNDSDFASTSLNAFMARGRSRWVEVRESVTDMLISGRTPAEAIVSVSDVTMHLPFEVADYVDFYASEHHAANLGRLFRPDAEPLLPNWKHLPVAYHGRAGTVVVSGTDVRRPCGQRKAPDEAVPTFGPSRRLDIEAEMGFVVGVPSDGPISPNEFSEHVFGAVIVNDWSARDIQAWEYVPLGPNLGKSFATSISPWVVPLLALEHARVSTPVQDPEPLEYLRESRSWALDIDLTVSWNGHVVSHPPYSAMYWSPAQMLAHETVNGATSRTGDLFASGTISGPEKNQRGAFIELTWCGAEPVQLGAETRTFLEDGDDVIIAASAPGANGSRIGFGDVRGLIAPA